MSDDPPAAVAAVMDKKNFAALPPKASNSDSSNSANNSSNKTPNKQDGTNNWALNPRGNGRRRGGSSDPSLPRSNSATSLSGTLTSGGSGGGRRYPPQKSKGLDKKPRSRGNNNGGSVDKRNNGPEVGSLQAPGAKKRDWDNLFYFAPREISPSVWKSHYTHRGMRGRNDSGGSGPYKSKFSKENFLRANCQFLVKPGKDYEPYLADPDLLVDWDDVEQIVVKFIGEGASCPICLGTPIAAKMTRCGHIYCWSCILHYLALSDNASRPCPICYESVFNKDLKSVVAHVHYDVELGDIIDMELLRRHKDMRSISPLHAHEATELWNELYSKIITISLTDVMEKVLDRELRELTVCFNEDPDCPEVCFIHQAIQELTDRKKALLIHDEAVEKDIDAETKTAEVGSAADSPPVSGHHSETLDSPSQSSDEYFHFYQDCRGTNVFMHPLNFSMLAKEFGTEMTLWPRYLSVRVIDKEYYSACEESRKRWKFLRHLPLSTPFIIIEVDLTEFVSKEVIQEFGSQIDYRKSRRSQRVKDEKKMEKIIAERERKLWQIPKIPHFEQKLDFPEFLDLTEDYASELGTTSECLMESSSSSPATTSFAQIAGRAPTPMKKSPSYPLGGSSGSGALNKVVSQGDGIRTGRRHSDSEPEHEDYVAVPEFRTSMQDAITKALENMALEEKEAGTKGQKKKKKNKGKVLFATGMGLN